MVCMCASLCMCMQVCVCGMHVCISVCMCVDISKYVCEHAAMKASMYPSGLYLITTQVRMYIKFQKFS